MSNCPNCCDSGVIRAIRPGERDSVCSCVDDRGDAIIVPHRSDSKEIRRLMMNVRVVPDYVPIYFRDENGQPALPPARFVVEEQKPASSPADSQSRCAAEIDTSQFRAVDFKITGHDGPSDLGGLVIDVDRRAPNTYTIEMTFGTGLNTQRRHFSGVPVDVIQMMRKMFASGDSVADVVAYLDAKFASVAKGPLEGYHGNSRVGIESKIEDLASMTFTVEVRDFVSKATWTFKRIPAGKVRAARRMLDYDAGSAKVTAMLREDEGVESPSLAQLDFWTPSDASSLHDDIEAVIVRYEAQDGLAPVRPALEEMVHLMVKSIVGAFVRKSINEVVGRHGRFSCSEPNKMTMPASKGGLLQGPSAFITGEREPESLLPKDRVGLSYVKETTFGGDSFAHEANRLLQD